MIKNARKEKPKTKKDSLNKEMLKFYKNENKKIKEKTKKENSIKQNWFIRNIKWILIVVIIILLISVFIGYNQILNTIIKMNKFAPKIFLFTFFILIIGIVLNFFNKNREDNYRSITIYLTILSLLLAFVEVIILSNQSAILNNQNNILDQTSQSIKPDVRVVSSQGYNSFLLSDVNNQDSFSNQIGIGLVNLGKINAPFVSVSSKYPGLFTGYFHYINQKGELVNWPFSIENFSSLGYEAARFYFNKDTRNNETIKAGINNLVFEVNCPFCQNPLREEIIPICVYTNETSKIVECEKEYL